MKASELLTDRVVRGIRRAILERFNADSCIASTAIGIAVLRDLGVTSRPVTCRLIGYNAPYVAWFDAEPGRWGEMPKAGEIPALRAAGAFSIAVGFDDGQDNPTKWAGHLLLAVDPKDGEDGYLVDLSADQAHRPAKGIPIDGPQVVRIPEHDWPGIASGQSMATSRRDDGSALAYFLAPEDRSYEGSPDWRKRSSRFRPLVKALVGAIRYGMTEVQP